MGILKAVSLSLALALGAAAATSVSAPSAIAAPKEGGTLVIGVVGVPRHFNGAIQSGIATALPSTQIFAGLLRYSENWDPEPYLAKSWEVSPDGLHYTMHLVDNAVFHDGVPITSKDVKFSIELVKAHHPFQTMLAPVTSVDTPDDHTVVINLAHPHPALLLAMSPALLPILPEHVYGKGDILTNPANLKPVGSGPFQFVEYKQGQYIHLKKFKDFFIKGRPYLDDIYIQIFSDQNNLVLATERGDVDMYPFLSSPRDISRLEKAKDIEIARKGGDGIGAINWLAFNTKKAPLDDVRVRQAIAYAIDRNFIVKTLLKDIAPVDTGPIVPTSPLATSDVEKFDVDIDKAKKLLDESGHPVGADGTRFTLTIDYIPGAEEMGRNIAEYIKSQLRKVDINIEVRDAPDFPTWAQRVSNYDFDLTMDTVFNWGDPVIGVNRTYLTSNIRKGVIWSNTQQYSNPKVDEILDQAAKEPDPAKRKALYAEFQKIVVSDMPIYYLNVVPYYIAYKKGLQDLPLGIWTAAAPLDKVHW